MAANDTAALVVALSAQVSKFQKDMDQAMGIADKSVKQIESRFASMNRQVSNELSSFAQNSASRLGLVGDALTALGPIGLGVAATVGVLALAYVTVSEKVDIFVEKAKRLADAAETTGLSITQLRLLATAGKEAGLDFEESEKFILRLTLALDELKTKSSGALFDQLLRISSGLVRQVASSKDTAAAIDILAKSYAELTDQQQKNALVAAISGKRNLAAGRLLDVVAENNGIKGLQESAVEAGKAIDEALIARLRDTKREIEEIKRRTENIWGSLFAESILNEQKQSAEFWERIAKAVAQAATFSASYQATNSNASQFGRRFRGADIPFVAEGTGTQFGPSTSNFLAEQLNRLGQSRLQTVAGGGGAVPLPQARPDISGKTPAATELELMKKWTSLLGDAITPAEALKQKILELSVAQKAGGVSDEQRARALAAFVNAQSAAALSARERLGIAKEDEISAQKTRELNKAITDEFVHGAGERVAAEQLIARESKAAAEALIVRRSQLPGLTREFLDAQNGLKQFDQIATGSLNSAADAFADVVTGTKNVSDAIHDMVNSILRDVARAAFKSAIASLFGGATGGGSFLSGIFGGARAAGGPVSSGRAFAVGESGPELFIPNQSGAIVPNDVLRRGGGGAPQIFITNHVDATGADVTAISRLTAGLAQVNRSIESRAVAALSAHRALRA